MIVYEMPDGLGIQFRGLRAPLVVRGDLVSGIVEWLFPLLDGKTHADEILKRRPQSISETDVKRVLMQLYMKGVIVAPDTGSPAVSNDLVLERQLFFWGRQISATRFNDSADEVVSKLSGASLLLIAEGLLGAVTLDLLLRMGIGNINLVDASPDQFVSKSFPQPRDGLREIEQAPNADAILKKLTDTLPFSDLVVSVLRNAPESTMLLLNEECVRMRKSWLRVHDDGSGIEVGPYVLPHQTPCFACMLSRQVGVNDNAVEEELYQQALTRGDIKQALKGESLSSASLAAGYVAQEVTRILTGLARPVTDGCLVRFGFDGAIDRWMFRKVARCQACYRGTVTLVTTGADRD